VRLRQYGVKPKVIRVGTATLRGYARADLRDAWLTYLPPPLPSPPTSATSATAATPDPGARECSSAPVALVADVALPALEETNNVCAHCGDAGTAGDPLLRAAINGEEFRRTAPAWTALGDDGAGGVDQEAPGGPPR
jgi:hypothetical protein